MDVINAAVIEHAQTSRSSGHRSKRARIDANGEHIADTEQVASSAAAKSSSRLDPEIVPLTPGMTPVPPVPTTDAHLNGCGKQKFEGAGNPPCTRCWSAGLECLCDKLSIEAATVTESDSEWVGLYPRCNLLLLRPTSLQTFPNPRKLHGNYTISNAEGSAGYGHLLPEPLYLFSVIFSHFFPAVTNYTIYWNSRHVDASQWSAYRGIRSQCPGKLRTKPPRSPWLSCSSDERIPSTTFTGLRYLSLSQPSCATVSTRPSTISGSLPAPLPRKCSGLQFL